MICFIAPTFLTPKAAFPAIRATRPPSSSTASSAGTGVRFESALVNERVCEGVFIFCAKRIKPATGYCAAAFESAAEEEKQGLKTEYIYEPSAENVLGFLLPQYLVTVIYAALLQAAASELSSRMNAMSSATDNAAELVSKLDLYYNKVRQASITGEITEIVGGAEALK